MSQPWRYQIRAGGGLGERWRDWFEDMEVRTSTQGGTEVTTLTGPVADQAALLGLLQKLYTLGMPLLSVWREEEGKKDVTPGCETSGL
jgi:hypothetical protein